MKNVNALTKNGFSINPVGLAVFSPTKSGQSFAWWNHNQNRQFVTYSNGHVTVAVDHSGIERVVYFIDNDGNTIALSNVKIAANVAQQVMGEIGVRVTDSTPSL